MKLTKKKKKIPSYAKVMKVLALAFIVAGLGMLVIRLFI